MKTLRWLLLLIIGFSSFNANAQAKLGITIDSFPQQIILGDTGLRYGYFSVHNYGSTTFSGSFTLNYVVNGVLYNSASDSGINFPSTSLNILPGDSSALQDLAVHINSPIFSIVGSSGVVIWPISPSALTFDSSYVQTEITFPAEINPVSTENLKVFITQQQLFINTTTQNLLNRVRIYDIQGQLLLSQQLYSSTSIPINSFAQGCYLIEVTLNDDSRRIFKLVYTGAR